MSSITLWKNAVARRRSLVTEMLGQKSLRWVNFFLEGTAKILS